MKAKKLLSLFGVLVFMISTVTVIAGCDHANSNNDNTSSAYDGLNIQPTGKADPALKGRWDNDKVRLYFVEEGNTVYMHDFESVYTVNGSTIFFDFSKSAKAWSAMTVDTYIDWLKADYSKSIAELEALLKTEQDAAKKKEYENQIEKAKAELEGLKNISPEEKAEMKEEIEYIKKAAKAIEPYAKFEGTLNADKTELTIEKFPVLNKDGTCKVEKLVFKKH